MGGEGRESIFPEVIIQTRMPPESEAICPFCKERPAIMEAFYRGVRVFCCSEKGCEEKATSEALETWRKARQEKLEAEFTLAKQQRETQ